MEVHIEKVKDLNHKTYNRLYRLNKGHLGWVMRPTLVAFRHDKSRYWIGPYGCRFRQIHNPDAYALYIKNSNNTIVSWSLLHSNRQDNNGANIWQAMFFTSAKHRRKGYGRIILNRTIEFSIKKFGMAPKYFPHDYVSEYFFDHVVPPELNKNCSECYYKYA